MIPESRLSGLRAYTYAFLMTKEGASRCAVGRFIADPVIRCLSYMVATFAFDAADDVWKSAAWGSEVYNASASALLSPISCLTSSDFVEHGAGVSWLQ